MPESTHRQALDSPRYRGKNVARRIAKEIIITGTEEHSNYMAFGKTIDNHLSTMAAILPGWLH